jgi:mRNA-degrading endonuclease RelE of RelBE toxin-antitoxin system
MDVNLSSRAERDLRRLGPGDDRRRVLDALRALGEGAPNLDVKPLVGRHPWRRLRAGDLRVIFRPIDHRTVLVERIVNRRELDRAGAGL